jgi:hypothetical protein
MLTSAEFLWRLNRDYVTRLARARTYLDLLEPMLLGGGADENEAFFTLQNVRAYLDSLGEEQREWCYTYFYQSPTNKRIVHSPRAITRALVSFEQMRARHHANLSYLTTRLDELPRPAADLTRVPTGDLWDRALAALLDLADFSPELET